MTKPKPDRFYKRERHRRQKRRAADRTFLRLACMRGFLTITLREDAPPGIIFAYDERLTPRQEAWAKSYGDAFRDAVRSMADGVVMVSWSSDG